MPLALTRSTPLPLEEFYGETAVGLAVGRAAGSATNPVAGNAEAIAAGKTAYDRACAGCHAPNGSGRGGVGGGEYFYPPATNLTAPGTQGKSDAELHWIVKHGLGFTGMPSYGARMDDGRIWNLVAYMRTLEPQP
jgi:mono/diheme cytochrome c family protein